MSNSALQSDSAKDELTQLAMKIIAEKGKKIDRSDLASAAGIARARIEAVFPEEDDLFDAIAGAWYAPDASIMEEVIASNLPIERKFYEFFARRFTRDQERYLADPALYALYLELGEAHFEHVRGYIDLADHYLTELIVQAQDEGYFAGLDIARALTLINQMLVCYTSPQMMLIIDARLTADKLRAIIDTIFAGLAAKESGAASASGLSAV
jgi:AcrR family transcriptional regulator